MPSNFCGFSAQGYSTSQAGSLDSIPLSALELLVEHGSSQLLD